jgi:hypothetical protein
MGLKDRMSGMSKKEYYVEGYDREQFSFREIETKIQAGEITSTTLICKPERKPFPNSSVSKDWKQANTFFELKKVFELLPPPLPKK